MNALEIIDEINRILEEVGVEDMPVYLENPDSSGSFDAWIARVEYVHRTNRESYIRIRCR